MHYLAQNFKVKTDLFKIVDQFLEKFKPQLSLADILVTKTGVTRCRTNVRFALDSLRELGLVISRDPTNQKRSFEPSLLGLIALLNIRLNFTESRNWPGFKYPDSLFLAKNEQKIDSFYRKDPLLLYSLDQFKKPGYLYLFLDNLKVVASKQEKQFLAKLIDEYVDFVAAGLEISGTGVRQTKLFAELSKKFQQNLFSLQQNHQELSKQFLSISKNFNHHDRK